MTILFFFGCSRDIASENTGQIKKNEFHWPKTVFLGKLSPWPLSCTGGLGWEYGGVVLFSSLLLLNLEATA